jgi:mRNA interferase HigB
MRVNNVKLLDEFTGRHRDAAGAVRAWKIEVQAASWAHSTDLKAQYKNASVIDSRWVVFNICGNRYRLAVKVNYAAGVVLVKKIGTHAEYDRWRYE